MSHPVRLSRLLFMPDRLCDVRFTSVKAKIDLSNVTINGRNGDFNATSLASVINKPTINKLVVQSWLEKACELQPDCACAER